MIFLIAFFFISSFLYADNLPVSLNQEISSLEGISVSASSSEERYQAFMSLARLNKLSGDSEKALEYLDGALKLAPGDGFALIEQGRLYISQGEYEKASESVSALLTRNQDTDILMQGRLMIAMLEAFRSGNLRPLTALAEEQDFIEYRSGIYYTLWKLSDLSVWKTRLTVEFPNSPEAKIALDSEIAASTLQWLLFPGREGLILSAPVGAAAPAVTSVTPAGGATLAVGGEVTPVAVDATATVLSPNTPVVAAPVSTVAALPAASGVILQTGLFGQEQNARALAERLGRAGFPAELQRRLVNGNNYWAVTVSGGSDFNAMIKKLKDAGFDSFPLR